MSEHSIAAAARAWLNAHPGATRRELAESGFLAPSWPTPYGFGATPAEHLLVEAELRRAGHDQSVNPVAIAWVGPALLEAGTADQQAVHLWPMLRGDESWCQLFSEPDVGSDLAAVRTRAVADGETFRINGQKTWTSWAHEADFGLLLARTEHVPGNPRRGLSFFLCPMDSPGITIRPIVDMTGCHTVNDVFFDDVELPAAALLGSPGQAWAITRRALANERWIVSGPGLLWGGGATIDDLVAVAAGIGVPSPILRQRLARIYTFARILEWGRHRAAAMQHGGRDLPGADVSLYKLLAVAAGVEAAALALALQGSDALLDDPGRLHLAATEKPRDWRHLFLYSPSFGVGGGTSEIQRNIIAETTLGLPREPIGAPAGQTPAVPALEFS